MFRVHGKVKRLLFFNPRDPKRQGTALGLRPGGAFRRRAGHGSNGIGWRFYLARHHMG